MELSKIRPLLEKVMAGEPIRQANKSWFSIEADVDSFAIGIENLPYLITHNLQ